VGNKGKNRPDEKKVRAPKGGRTDEKKVRTLKRGRTNQKKHKALYISICKLLLYSGIKQRWIDDHPKGGHTT